MIRPLRWDPCIAHRGAEVDSFIADYFADAGRTVLLIAGAGFDPRSTAVAERLSAAVAPVRAILFQESRPKPAQGLIDRAKVNAGALTSAVVDHVLILLRSLGATVPSLVDGMLSASWGARRSTASPTSSSTPAPFRSARAFRLFATW